MRKRSEIEKSFKDAFVPSGRDDILINLEILLDIRDLMEELVKVKKYERNLSKASISRQLAKKKRSKKS